jgi:hypothetical protein
MVVKAVPRDWSGNLSREREAAIEAGHPGLAVLEAAKLLMSGPIPATTQGKMPVPGR